MAYSGDGKDDSGGRSSARAAEGLEGAEGQGSRGNDGGAHRGPVGVVGELGEGWSRRGGEDDLRRPEMKTAAMATLQGLPRRVA